MMKRKVYLRQMHFRRWALLSGLIAVFLFLGVALAAGEQLSRQVIGSGGGRISSGDVRLHSVIGQPLAGPLSSGGLGLCSGFLCGSTVGGGDDGGEPPGPNSVYLPLVVKR